MTNPPRINALRPEYLAELSQVRDVYLLDHPTVKGNDPGLVAALLVVREKHGAIWRAERLATAQA